MNLPALFGHSALICGIWQDQTGCWNHNLVSPGPADTHRRNKQIGVGGSLLTLVTFEL